MSDETQDPSSGDDSSAEAFLDAGRDIAASGTDAKWYYSRDGVKTGPFSSSKLRSLARSGDLRESDLLWKEGMDQWRPAGEAGRLFGRRSRRRRPGRGREDDSKRRQAAAPQPAAAEPSRFRSWALEAGCPAALLEPVPVAGAVAGCLLAIWLIVWLLMLASADTAQLVNDVKDQVIAEGGEVVSQATDAATRGLIGDEEEEDGSQTTPPAKPRPPAAPAAAAAEQGGSDASEADF